MKYYRTPKGHFLPRHNGIPILPVGSRITDMGRCDGDPVTVVFKNISDLEAVLRKGSGRVSEDAPCLGR